MHPSISNQLAKISALVDSLIAETNELRRCVHAQAMVEHGRPTILGIQSAVCEVFGYPLDVMRDKCRSQRRVLARQLAISLARELTILSSDEIAMAFGFTRGIVPHSIKAVADRQTIDKHFAATVAEVRDRLSASAPVQKEAAA